MTSRSTTRLGLVLGSLLVLGTGCGALIGTKDIFYDDLGDGGAPEASTADGPATGDAGTDAAACTAQVDTDAKNCGRCGHDCAGGECRGGRCQAVQLAAVSNAPLYDVSTSAESVFATSYVSLVTEEGGIWRVAKAGGLPEKYVDLRSAVASVVLGDTLYFVVEDTGPAGTGTGTGGFYSCPVKGAAPCTPHLIAASTGSSAMSLDGTTIYFEDATDGRGLMRSVNGAVPTVHRSGFGFGANCYADDAHAFYTAALTNSPRHTTLFEAFEDGGANVVSTYPNEFADPGTLKGTADYLLFTSYDIKKTSGGVVRRIPRSGTVAPCDFGGSTNKRPFGVSYDATRVYWANQGDGDDQPYLGGSVVTCELSGCCAAGDPLWSGDAWPTAVTVDDSAVYFVTRATGGIWKVAKP
ncbi:MAG: hypothetical protein JWP97_1631 [Labilithrix sp.]|nr:hypothetical protein [Labilithrix sp.]